MRVSGLLLGRAVETECPDDPVGMEPVVETEEGAGILSMQWKGPGEPPRFRILSDYLFGEHEVPGSCRRC